ncbi:NADH dehydrogenase [Enterococcus canis]|uniref:NADH dehydrogenase n=1 Tax=Enterococcus canis TaxID=214095 RepID=A0A1L8RF35_9ENTE|nr:NAD(P)/FAD-dependent oxidoreductase [Enterococcus canis]OJG18390.1 NADH dehydrogenase [Enterococcus canis]
MKEVVILGAGYGGLRALHVLQSHQGEFHVTLVDRNDYHYESTDLHEVAAGTQPAERIQYPIEDVVNSKTTTFIKDEVTLIDRTQKQVTLKGGQTLPYDYLVVSLGFQSETFGIPGAAENALQLEDVETAKQALAHIEAQMKGYAQDPKPEALNIVVCGAGFTGIELLGALAENKETYAKWAGVEAKEIKLYCIEAVTRLLPMFDEKLADYGIDHLKEWGVEFLTGKPIKEIKPGVVIYQEDAATNTNAELAAGTIIWTTGVSGSHVMGDSGFNQRRGRVTVADDLSDPDHSEVFIIGDVAAVMDPDNQRPYPTTAQIALKMGATAGKNILHLLAGEATEKFTFHSLGSVASIGNTHAFGVVGKTNVKGYPASFIKKGILDRSLFETGGVKEVLSKGRFDFYH